MISILGKLVKKGILKAENCHRVFINFRFVQKLFSKESEVYISLGKAMDVFGNTINENGESIDKFGHIVHLEDYFTTDGMIKDDAQREHLHQIVGRSSSSGIQ